MVKVYSTHCPKCNQLEKLLEKENVKFEVIDDVKYMTEVKGFMGNMPKMELEDGTVLEFADAWKWVRQNGQEA